MKKLMLLVALVAGGFVLMSSQSAKADHWRGCRSGWGGHHHGGHYSYTPRYYSHRPVFDYGYGYPASGVYYSRPGFSISIGSGYRGYGYGGWGGHHRGHGHHHHHHDD